MTNADREADYQELYWCLQEERCKILKLMRKLEDHKAATKQCLELLEKGSVDAAIDHLLPYLD